jgi:hypothetical protein
VRDLCAVYPIEKHLEQIKEFTIVLQKAQQKISYTDFLLCACLFKFPDTYLLTENYLHIPLSIFDRKYLTVIDTDKEVRTHGIYQFSQSKFDKAAKRVIKTYFLTNQIHSCFPSQPTRSTT